MHDVQLHDQAFVNSIALPVAGGTAACFFRAYQRFGTILKFDIQPAVVTVVASGSATDGRMPADHTQHSLHGVLVLPQTPGVVLAQLSVSLYVHRFTVVLPS